MVQRALWRTNRAAGYAAASSVAGEDAGLVGALCRGEERAFERVLALYSPAMLRLAVIYVRDRALAEDVVQEAWLGVLRGLGRFEGRSALKTWIFRILVNRAKSAARRAGTAVPFSELAAREAGASQPPVAPERFLGEDDPEWPHHWVTPPQRWGETPEGQVLADEVQERLQGALDALPPAQRAVITLRDIEGWRPAEVCSLLGIKAGNQRVLLHRARSKVRGTLERYFQE